MYIQLVLGYLNEKYSQDICKILYAERANVHNNYYNEVPLGIYEDNEARNIIISFMDILEEKIRDIISKKSPVYWLLLYRNIYKNWGFNVFDEGVDFLTLHNVITITEAVIRKHANLNGSSGLYMKKDISLEEIMGGLLCQILETNSTVKKAFDKYYHDSTNFDLYLKEFEEEDLFNLCRVHMMSYLHYMEACKLRLLAKGGQLKVCGPNTQILASEELKKLASSYDKRKENYNPPSDIKGNYLGNALWNPDKFDAFCARYNIENVNSFNPPAEYSELKGMIGNFRVSPASLLQVALDLSGYEEEFLKIYKIDVVSFFKILCAFLSYPISVDNSKPNVLRVLSEIAQNGCLSYYMIQPENFYPRLVEAIQHTCLPAVSTESILCVLNALTLREENRNIALWSQGPYHIAIKDSTSCIVDYVNIILFALHILYGKIFKDESKGDKFHDTIAAALEKNGFELEVDKACESFCEGMRKPDIVVSLENNVIVIIECVSYERPLDFEYGNKEKIGKRQKWLESKLEQARTAKVFLERNAVGKNYNYGCAKRFEYLVASPFVEWVWSLSPEYWVNGEIPRILSPFEVVEALKYFESEN